MLASYEELENENRHIRSELKYYREQIDDLRQVVSQLTGTTDRTKPRLIHPADLHEMINSATMRSVLVYNSEYPLPDYQEIDGVKYKQSANMPVGFAHIEVSNFKKPTIR